MKTYQLLYLLGIMLLLQCNQPETTHTETAKPDFSGISQVDSGKAISVMLTSYSTTLLANGSDQTRLRIAITDSLSREITSATDSIRVYVEGDGKVKSADGGELITQTDTTGQVYLVCQLKGGVCDLLFVAGNTPGKVKVEAKSGKLWPGGHEIHTLPADLVMIQPTKEQFPAPTKNLCRMIGADISFLPQIEDRGAKFSENGIETDAIGLLKNMVSITSVCAFL
jgi:beta-galactosidase